MWPILLCSVTAAAITIHKLLQYRSVRRALSYTPQEIMIKKPAQLEPLVSALAEALDEEEIAVIGTRQIRNLEDFAAAGADRNRYRHDPGVSDHRSARQSDQPHIVGRRDMGSTDNNGSRAFCSNSCTSCLSSAGSRA